MRRCVASKGRYKFSSELKFGEGYTGDEFEGIVRNSLNGGHRCRVLWMVRSKQRGQCVRFE